MIAHALGPLSAIPTMASVFLFYFKPVIAAHGGFLLLHTTQERIRKLNKMASAPKTNKSSSERFLGDNSARNTQFHLTGCAFRIAARWKNARLYGLQPRGMNRRDHLFRRRE